MWTRIELKQRAKGVLRRNYWKAFVISLVIAFAANIGTSSSSSNVGNRVGDVITETYDGISNGGYHGNNYGTSGYNTNIVQSYSSTALLNISTIAVGLFGIIIIMLSLAFRLLLGYHLEVGGRKFFIQAAHGEDNMSYLSYVLKKDYYVNVLKTMFFRGLYTFLWSLLCVIPGIIKGYAYSMVPYILADNPEIDYKRALELSEHMTNGHKMDMWVLDLSFLGWQLLGLLVCCIGGVFVNPYVNATYAELYLRLRQNAIETGYTAENELNLRLQ